jgi:ubiquinone/menaquinone biosynthesis C-methylase UbiE
MKREYLSIVYKNREKSGYPQELAEHIYQEIMWPEGHQSFLDVGCGDKTFMKEFEKMGFKCEGIDYPMVDFELDCLPYKDNSFNYVFCKSVIEHVSHTDLFVEELYRVLKPGGTLILLTPSWSHVYKDFYNDYTHVKPFYRKGLQDCLKIHKFEDVEVKYFYQLPFLWRMPFLMPLVKLIQLLPDSWKWKDKEETKHNKIIRFSKEVMLMGVGRK